MTRHHSPTVRWAPRLRTHLLALVACAVLPWVVAGAVAAALALNAYRQGFEAHLQQTARAMALVLDAEVERLKPVLQTLSDAPFLTPRSGPGDYEEFYRRSRRLAERLGTSIGFRGPGPDYPLRFVTSYPFDAGPAAPLTSVVRLAMERAATTGQPVLTELIAGLPETGPLALLVAPVRRDEQEIGFMSMWVSPARLSRTLASQRLEPGIVVALVDNRGQIAARSEDAHLFVGRPAPHWYLSQIEGLSDGSLTGPNLAGEVSILAFDRLQQAPGWTVAVLMSQRLYNDTWFRPLTSLLMGAVLTSLCGCAAAWVMARRLTQPLARVGEQAAAVARGEVLLDLKEGRDTPSLRVAEVEELRASVGVMHQALREKADEAERERELLRSILDDTGDCVFVKDLAGRYVLVNRVAARALDRTVPEILGRTDAELLPLAAPIFNESDRRVLAEERTLTFEEVSSDAAGGRRVFRSTKSPWREPSTGRVVGIIGVAHDITERLQTEDRLRSAEHGLQQLARRATVGAMASGIAHELNQPLGAAGNFLAGAARLLAGPPSEVERRDQAVHALEKARAQVMRAGDIIRRLRDFLGGGDTVRKLAPVEEVVREAVAMALAAAPDAAPDGVRFEVADGTGNADMDRVQVQQVVVNLVRNALEAMQDQPEGDLRDLLVAMQPLGVDRVEVSLADRGCGLAPDVAQHLFDAFRSTKASGLGIGLSICRTIVEAHGGRIRAEARPGGGTIFRFTLMRDGGRQERLGPRGEAA